MAFSNDAERIAQAPVKNNWFALIGIGVGVTALMMYSSLKTNHPDPVQQVKTEIGTPVKAEAERKAAYEANAKVIAAAVKAEKDSKAANEIREKVQKLKEENRVEQMPQECIDGGLTEYECGFWERAQQRKAEGPTWSGDQFEQNRKDAFAKDGGGNYIMN